MYCFSFLFWVGSTRESDVVLTDTVSLGKRVYNNAMKVYAVTRSADKNRVVRDIHDEHTVRLGSEMSTAGISIPRDRSLYLDLMLFTVRTRGREAPRMVMHIE